MTGILSATYERDEIRFPRNHPSITVPSHVTSIGDGAFANYKKLTTIIISPSVTSIGDAVFSSCTSLITINIPPSVTHLGDCAFIGCASLITITIPPSITSIGDDVFFGCTSLTTVTIPPSVKSLGDGAFCGCTSLTDIKIPQSVISIGKHAFSACISLANIVIPPSVTSIGPRAFRYCTSLATITIPPSVNSLGDNNIFDRCESLSSINLTLPLVLEAHSQPNLFAEAIRAMGPKKINAWAKTGQQDNRLPLFSAAAASLEWKYTKLIFNANMMAIYEKDMMTGLSPFMLAAVGLNSDIETVYRLCREYPPAISQYIYI